MVNLANEPLKTALEKTIHEKIYHEAEPVHALDATSNIIDPIQQPEIQKTKKIIILPVIAGLLSGFLGGIAGYLTLPIIQQQYSMLLNPPSEIPAPETAKPLAQAENPDLKLITDKIAALEAKMTSQPIAVTQESIVTPDIAIGAAITPLLSRMEKLEQARSTPSQLDSSITPRVNKIETSLTEITARQATQSTSQSGAALLIATDVLRRQFERGQSFSVELAAIETWVDPGFNLTGLKLHAENGLPILPVIIQKFNAISRSLTQDDTAQNTDMLERFKKATVGLIKTRPANEQAGRDPVSIISRTTAALQRKDASGALDELSMLPEPALSRAASVIADLKSQVQVDAAIRALEQNAIQRLKLKVN